MSEAEIWKPVVGWESAYAVSSDGRVWNVRWNREVKATKLDHGYCQVDLRENCRKKKRAVHHLVLEAFVGLAPQGTECDHVNGVKHDNRLLNLQWVTKSENAIRAYRLGLHKPNRPRVSPDDVRLIRSLSSSMNCYQIARRVGFGKTTVRDIILGKRWSNVA